METLVMSPIPKMKGIAKIELAKVRAASSVTPTSPTITVSVMTMSIWLTCPMIMGIDRMAVFLPSLRRAGMESPPTISRNCDSRSFRILRRCR